MIIGIMIFNVVYALGELAIMYPISGGFYTYSSRFIDPSWGFAMGWNYVFQWAAVLPLEITVAAEVLKFWDTDVHPAVWITIFLLAIIIINVFGVLGYGEEEFWSSALKLSAVVIFMIISLVLVCGGGPSRGIYNEYWGARFVYGLIIFAFTNSSPDSGTIQVLSATASKASAPSSSQPPSPFQVPRLLVLPQQNQPHR